MRRSIVRLSTIAALFCGTSAFAQSGPWVVSEVQGQVVVINAAGSGAAQRGTRVAPGETVRTGDSGNAVLVRGREFVTVRRNTQIRIPTETGERSVIQIVQDWGSALFNIGKQPNPHFGVKTEYLAAVVKGTTFTVTVAPEGASMQVLEGAVEVSTDDGGARDLVRPGSVAMVAAGDRFRLVVEGSQRKVIDSPARPAQPPAAATLPTAAPASPAPAAPTSPSSEPVVPQASALGGSDVLARIAPARFITATLGSDGADLSKLSGGLIEGETLGFTAQIVAEAAVLAGRGGSAEANSIQSSKADKDKADKDKADQDKADQDKADKDKADQDKADKDKADKDKADKDKADKDKADKDKADKDKADKDKADKDKADKDKADQDKADQDKADQDKADKDKADKDKADKDKADKDKADQDKAYQDKADQDKAGKDKSDRDNDDDEEDKSGKGSGKKGGDDDD